MTKVDMPADGSEHDLVRVTVAALQLNPDILVIFAGNNWLTPIKPFARSDPDHLRSFAPAYREASVRGIMDQCEQNTRSHFAGVVKNLSYIAATVPIPIVLVIPEVNQRDWVRGLPVSWLEDDRTANWHKLYVKALALKSRHDNSQSELIGSIAQQMIELDEGTCPVSYRLFAEARLAQGRTAEARALFMREVDSAAWNPAALPGAGSTVRELLRSGARSEGLACVDLPEIFFEHSANIPGRDLFLDYCHLTLEGIKVAMAAVASKILHLTLRRAGVKQKGRHRAFLDSICRISECAVVPGPSRKLISPEWIDTNTRQIRHFGFLSQLEVLVPIPLPFGQPGVEDLRPGYSTLTTLSCLSRLDYS